MIASNPFLESPRVMSMTFSRRLSSGKVTRSMESASSPSSSTQSGCRLIAFVTALVSGSLVGGGGEQSSWATSQHNRRTYRHRIRPVVRACKPAHRTYLWA